MFKKKAGFLPVWLVFVASLTFVANAPVVYAQIEELSTEFDDGTTGPWSQSDGAAFDTEVRPGWLQVSSGPNSFGSLDIGDVFGEILGIPVNIYPPPWHLELSLERPTDVATAIGFLGQGDGIQYLFNNLPDSTGVDGRMSFGWGALFPGFNNKGSFALPNFAGVPEEAMAGPAIDIWVGIIDNRTMKYGIRVTGTEDWHFAPDVKGFFDLDADPVSFQTFKIMIENRQPWFDQWGNTFAPLEEVVVDFDYIRFFADALLPDPPEIADVSGGAGQATIEWDAPDDIQGVTVAGYNVYRSHPAPFERLNAEPVTEEEFSVDGLLQGTEYCFVVRSIGDNGYESISSEPDCDFTEGGEIAELSNEFSFALGLWEATDSGETSLDANPGLLELRTPAGSLGSISLDGGLRVDQFPTPWHFEVSLLRDVNTPTAIGVSFESDGIQYLFNNFPGGTGPDGAVSFGAGASTNASGKGVFELPDFSGVGEFDLGGPAIEFWVGAIDNTTMRFGVRQAGSAAWRFAPDVSGYDLAGDPTSFRSLKIVLENRQQWYDQWPGTEVANTDAVVEIEYIRFFPETPAPNAPQFVAAAASDTGVTLNWRPPPATPGVGIIGYNVYQTVPEVELLTFAPAGQPPFIAPSFIEGAEHCYYVRTVGDNGLESANSNTACATTLIFGDIESLSTEFDNTLGPWSPADAGSISLDARPGWLRLSTPANTFGTISLTDGLPVDIYEPEWHFEMRIQRPTNINTAIGFLSQSDGIQHLFTHIPGATGPNGRISFAQGAAWNATEKGMFGVPDFSTVEESAMAGEAIEIWVGVVDTQTMRYGVRPAGTDSWSFAPDLVGGTNLDDPPVSFGSVKIMLENRQGFFNSWPDTQAPDQAVSVDIDYIRFFEGESARPNSPKNVTAVAGGSDVSLSWEAPDPVDGVTISGYNVFRTLPGRVQLNGDLVTDTQFHVPGLIGQRDYCFVVRAVGGNGFPSDDSDEVCATPTDKPPPTPSIETGLLGYWPLEDGEDCSANGRDLEVSGEVTFEPGLIGDGLAISGGALAAPGPAYRNSDDAVFDFDASDFTISLWVNFSSLGGEQVLIEKFTGGDGPGWTLTKLATGTFLFYAGGGFGAVTSDLPGFEENTWHHVVVRKFDTTMELFVDTAVVGSSFTVTGAISDSPDPLIIGMRNQGDGRGFVVNGVIDEVALWDRAITDSDITDLYGDGFGAPEICETCAATEPDGETSCDDGEDNDCDGTVDGDDPDCAACAPTEPEGETSCEDGEDNDCDEAVDGDDPDCAACAPTEPEGEISCEDGEDNDCDEAVDGDDPDCAEEEGVGPFIRGDCDGNGQVGGSPTEAIVLLNFSFRGGAAPGCLAACDAEANGSLGITDALRILRHSFLGQGEPDAPFPNCVNSDLGSDVQLGCETPIACP